MKLKHYGIPPIVEDTIRDRARLAYGQSRSKHLLTDANGGLCRRLAEHFPLPVELAVIEEVFADEWFRCQKGTNR